MKTKIAALVAGALLIGAPGAASAAESIAGDRDCFGLAASCPDGTLWRDQLGGTFFTSNQGPGDAPYTDTWDSFVDPTFHLANPGGGSVTLETRIAGVADGRGPWDVFVNGIQVGTIPTNNGPNAFQEVKTYSFNVPLADLMANNTILLKINDPVFSDGYDIDYVSLIGSGGVVPEPASWAMMLLGFFGLGSVLRTSRRKATTLA